jgi:hypothetical protein
MSIDEMEFRLRKAHELNERQEATIATLRAVEKAARKRAETGHDINCQALMPSAGRPHRCDCGQSGLDTALAKVKEAK